MVPISSWEPPEMCNDTKLQKISRSGPGLGHANSPFVFLKNNRILTQLLPLLFIGSGKIFYRNPNIWKGPHGHRSSGGGGGTKRIKQGWLEDKKNVWNESTAGLCDACLCLLLCEVLFVKPLISPRGLLPCDTATALGLSLLIYPQSCWERPSCSQTRAGKPPPRSQGCQNKFYLTVVLFFFE